MFTLLKLSYPKHVHTLCFYIHLLRFFLTLISNLSVPPTNTSSSLKDKTRFLSMPYETTHRSVFWSLPLIFSPSLLLSLSCSLVQSLLSPSSLHHLPLQSHWNVLIVGALVQPAMKSVLLLLLLPPLPLPPSLSTWKLIWSPPDAYRHWNAPRNRSTNSSSAKTPSLPDSL